MERPVPTRSRRRRARVITSAAVLIVLTAGCTTGGRSPREAATTTTTPTGMSTTTAEAPAPVTKIDIASVPGGVAADATGVWVPQAGRMVRLDNTGTQVGESRPNPPDRRILGPAGSMATGDGALFVASSQGLDAEGDLPAVFGWVARLDPGTGKVAVSRRISDGRVGSPASLSLGPSGLWALAGPRLVRFDPKTLDTVTIVDGAPPVGTGYSSVAVGDGAVYASNAASGRVSRFDVTTGRLTHEATLGRRIGGFPITFTASAVWAAGQNELLELDPEDLSVRRRVAAPVAANELTAAGGDLWAYSEDGLYVLRAGRSTLTRVAALGGSGHWGGLAIGGRYAWLGDYPNDALWRVDVRAGDAASPRP